MSRASTSPRARRRNPPQAWRPTRDRREVIVTVAVVVGIVAASALLVWLLRPASTPGAAADGLLARQARIGWFIVLLVAAFGIGYVLLRQRASRIVSLGVAAVLTVVLGTVAAWFWPGGLLKEYTPIVPPPPGQPDPGPLPPAEPNPFPTTTAPTAPTAPGTEIPEPTGDLAPVPAPDGGEPIDPDSPVVTEAPAAPPGP